jgi:hypothetical protein
MAGSVVCGVDDQVDAEAVVRVGRALAARLGVPLVRVRTVVAEHGQGGGRSPRRYRAGDRLLAAARKEDAVLIVIASSDAGSALAAVSADVARRASCPVVVVPRGADLALARVAAEEVHAARFPGLLDDGYNGGRALGDGGARRVEPGRRG